MEIFLLTLSALFSSAMVVIIKREAAEFARHLEAIELLCNRRSR